MEHYNETHKQKCGNAVAEDKQKCGDAVAAGQTKVRLN
jgi:hypothetical protein